MTDYTASGKAFSQLIVEVFRLNGRLLAHGNLLMGGLGLNSARWQVLGAILLAEEPETVAGLARNMGLARQSVQRLVNEMAADGLVRLEENPHHARARLVRLTDRGSVALKSAFERQVPWVNGVAADVDDQSIEAATRILGLLRERLP